MAMQESQLILAFLVAGGLGAVVGLERQVGPGVGDVSGGTRTFAIFGIWGALSGYAGSRFGAAALLGSLVAFAALILVAYLSIARQTGDWGITTESAAVVTFLTGVLVFDEQYVAAVAVTVGLAAILQSKAWLANVVERFSQDDVIAVLQFGVITAIVLPLIPDDAFGPLNAINPREIWLMVIFVSGIGLVGYVSLRILGQRGLGLSGLLGGLVSSTAVTLGFSKMSKVRGGLTPALIAGVIGASGLMFPRVFVEAVVIAPELAEELLIPLGTLTVLVGAVAAYWFTRPITDPDDTGETVETKNPLSLSTALKFGAVYGVIVFVSKFLIDRFSDSSLLFVAGLSGLNDVDAITLSTANLVADGLATSTGARSILVAVAVNTIVKAALAASLGSPKLRRMVLMTLGPAAVIAVVAATLV